jgi:hypothetical protein
VPPRPGQSKALLDQLLAGHDSVVVEAAIARLAIAGRPALRQVLQHLENAEPAHLPRLLRVLERLADPSALPAVRPFLTHPTLDVAVAAVDAVGAVLDARDARVATAALDALTATLLDGTRDDVIRLRAWEAIANAPEPTVSYDADVLAPLRLQLRDDASPALRAAAGGGQDDVPLLLDEPSGEAQLAAAAAGTLPLDPEHLRQLLGSHGADAPLTALQRVIERVRAHESTVDQESVEAWRVVRATAHQALALRGSRLALYDIRESLAALGAQTPVGMLAALQQVGDASALDAVAEAYAATDDAWFRGQLAGVFRAIVSRDQLTRRSAAAKKLATRLPEAFAALWG